MLLLNILILISNFYSFPINSEQSQFIKFEYTGETTKPIPTILFYNSESIDSILLSKEENSIKVSQNEFDVIKEVVSRQIAQASCISKGFYQFAIAAKREKQMLLTAKKDVVRLIFIDIINILPDDERKEKVQTFWNGISSRF